MAGEKASLLLTDPPYNVALGSHDSPDAARRLHRRTDGLVIENDNWADDEAFAAFLGKVLGGCAEHMKAGAAFYVWCASQTMGSFLKAADQCELQVRQHLIWAKNAFTLGRQDYQWQHEPCLYGWTAGAAHYWGGDRKQSTVLNFDRPARSELHPTMKPVKLFDYQIRNSSRPGDIVLDPFAGSGTTLIACEQNRRTARVVEIDPRYGAAIIRRWEQLTGLKAEKLD